MEGSGKSCQKVIDHQTLDFAGQSPVVVITEGGSEWQRFTSRGGRPIGHQLAVHLFVLYATPDGAITEEDSEGMLSPILADLAGVVYEHQTDDLWAAIDWTSMSQIMPARINGADYRHETVTLTFR